MTWTPPSSVLETSAAAPSIPYDGGGAWDPSQCASSPTGRAQQLAAILRGLFPAVTQVQMLNCRPNTGLSTTQLSIHAVGRALDVMVPDATTGAAVADWAVTWASSYGIQLVIWDNVVWQGSLPPSQRFAAYTGSSEHTDHVHVELNTVEGYPGGPHAPELTFPASGMDWVNSRFAMLVEVLDELWLPFDLSLAIAWAMLPQLTIEVGPFHAQHEWNWNVGNIRCTRAIAAPSDPGWHGACHWITDPSAALFRSYPSLYDGTWDYVRLQRERYRNAFLYLLDNPSDGAGWYRKVVEAGYSTADADTLVTMYASVQADLARRRA